MFQTLVRMHYEYTSTTKQILTLNFLELFGKKMQLHLLRDKCFLRNLINGESL